MGSAALGNHAYGLCKSLLARAVFTRSIKVSGWQPGAIKVLGWQPGAPKSRERDFPQNPGSTIFRKKNVLLLKIIGPVTPLWVL